MSRRLASWAALALVVVVALAVGAGDGSPPTDAERVQRISADFRCPTCRSQSVADSDAPAARFIKEDIKRRVEAGETDQQIRDYLLTRYQDDILLDPPKRGVSALVWLLPPLAVAAAVGGLAVAFRRWRPRGRRVSAEDRALVEQALEES